MPVSNGLKRGAKVQRVRGSYRFPGTIVGDGVTSRGRLVFIVEHETEVGMLHIYGENDLEQRKPPGPRDV